MHDSEYTRNQGIVCFIWVVFVVHGLCLSKTARADENRNRAEEAVCPADTELSNVLAPHHHPVLPAGPAEAPLTQGWSGSC